MNAITVTAHGAPGSFVRRVQEDPTIAVELLVAARKALAFFESWAKHTGDIKPLRDAVTKAEARNG